MVAPERRAQPVKFGARIRLGRRRRVESGRTDEDLMSERPRGGLLFRIDPIPHRAALHEDNRVVSVFAGDGGGQACDEPRFGAAGDQLKAAGGKVVTFIHHQMAVSPGAVVHYAFVGEALHKRHIQAARELLPTTSEPPDHFRRKAQECGQALDPLFQELLAVNKNKSAHATSSNEPGRDHGFAKRRCAGENSGVVRQHRVRSRLLFGPQRAAKVHVQRSAAAALVADEWLDLQ